ncbi:MAG: TniQ family protein [Gammaproteobacteria bacterium]|nr:TniQ family protein [Gammaproteobacteria bacterium]
MRRIRPKERANGMRYCTFCKPEKVHAVWRTQWLTQDQKTQFACPRHKDQLVDGIQFKPDPNYKPKPDDGHMSEADYQSWNNKNVFF